MEHRDPKSKSTRKPSQPASSTDPAAKSAQTASSKYASSELPADQHPTDLPNQASESSDPEILAELVIPMTEDDYPAQFVDLSALDLESELSHVTPAVVVDDSGPVDLAEPVDLVGSGDPEDSREQAIRRQFMLAAIPSWLISLLIHVALILILAAISLDPVQHAISVLQASTSESISTIEQFDLQGPMLDISSDALDTPLAAPTVALTQVVQMPELESPIIPSMKMSVDSLDANRQTESVMPSSLLNNAAMAQMATALNSRSSASKSEMLERYGGNAASEKAVALALKWLADHQAPNGGWSFAHSAICGNRCGDPGELAFATNGATAMALLPFLGAGQTHLEGSYKETVYRGLAFLINRMKVTSGAMPQGSWHEAGGTMYSHGLAAITVCEAYAMTRDPDLLQPAQLSLNYLVASQDKRGGGWRYEPGQPGDTSVVGWCLMALKSGRMGNLVVPDATFQGAQQFLDFVSTNQGAYYGYKEPTAKLDGREATIAVGLLCRMYLGWPKEHPGLQEGMQRLSQVGPSMNNLYYSYYATQVMRHQGGQEWEKWNEAMRNSLVESQEQRGHAAGSWKPTGHHARKGGRLYQTSLAAMILEVYYRHMPLYSERSSQDDFEI